jgi:RNA polymerase sigma-70 factor (ECF subfamily)
LFFAHRFSVSGVGSFVEITLHSCLNATVSEPEDPSTPVPLPGLDEDALLMLRAGKEEDTDAFGLLVQKYSSTVIGTVGGMLGDWAEAEDLAQKVFLAAWKSRSSYRPTARFKTWLMTITRNFVYNEIRRRKRHPASSLDADSGGLLVEDFGHASRPPHAILAASEVESAVEEALLALPENQRMAMLLLRHEHLSYEEIGRVLGLRVSAVKSLIFRARTELRQRLERFLDA